MAQYTRYYQFRRIIFAQNIAGFMMRWLLIICVLLQPLAGYSIGYDTTVAPADASVNVYLPLLTGKRVAVIVNQTSRIGDKLLPDVLLANHIQVVKIFSPEHGFRGHEDAGATVGNSTDSATGLPVISLYGAHKKPTTADLADVDIVIYDLQDVGVRFYTYISTLQYAMEACAKNNKPFMVLDRPNPNGFYVDGPVLDKGSRSFVGMQSIPIVYGMTAGEYAKMLVGEQWFDSAAYLNLQVIPCLNYDHKKRYKLPVSPSPNLKTMAAVYAYPSMCLFEGTQISVGRGTNMPFQQWGCPEFTGVFMYAFTPHSTDGAKDPPYKDKVCHGEAIGASESLVLEKIKNGINLTWLLKAYNAYPDKTKFFNGMFIKLAGASLKKQLEDGLSADAIKASWQTDLKVFKTIRKKYLLYKDFED